MSRRFTGELPTTRGPATEIRASRSDDAHAPGRCPHGAKTKRLPRARSRSRRRRLSSAACSWPGVTTFVCSCLCFGPLVGQGIGLIIGKAGSWNWLSEKAVPILRSWVFQLAHYGKLGLSLNRLGLAKLGSADRAGGAIRRQRAVASSWPASGPLVGLLRAHSLAHMSPPRPTRGHTSAPRLSCRER